MEQANDQAKNTSALKNRSAQDQKQNVSHQNKFPLVLFEDRVQLQRTFRRTDNNCDTPALRIHVKTAVASSRARYSLQLGSASAQNELERDSPRSRACVEYSSTWVSASAKIDAFDPHQTASVPGMVSMIPAQMSAFHLTYFSTPTVS